MSFAVIKASGSQYKVSEGEEIKLDRVEKEQEEKIEFPEVLLLVDNGKVTLGQPFIKNCRVIGQVVNHYKGDKIRVATYKAKSRYRKVKGYRHQYTTVLIKDVKVLNSKSEARNTKQIRNPKSK